MPFGSKHEVGRMCADQLFRSAVAECCAAVCLWAGGGGVRLHPFSGQEWA
jgi:hypothetical protein